MITDQKFKLFSNDPKFRQVTITNPYSQQIAIQKVYAGQKQLHRKKIIMDCIQKKTNPNIGKPDLQIDFLQSRIHAYEIQLAQDIEKFDKEVEFIVATNYQSRNIEKLIEGRVAELSRQMEEIDDLVTKRQFQQLKTVENSVEEIDRLFKQNQSLKKENAEITARISLKKRQAQQQQQQPTLKKLLKPPTNSKVQKR